MKTFLVVAALIGAAYAGVGVLSPQEEAQALQLFAQICGSGSEGTNLGDTLVYCKRARGDLQETLNHQVNVASGGGSQSQVVFVQPPPVRYVHRVAIQGSAGQGQQAKIYVLPQKASHELTAQYQGGGTNAVKPVVYFLKGDQNGGNNGGNNGGYQQGGSSGGYQQGGSSGGSFIQPVIRTSGGYN